jgi:hypothetical protein
MTVIDRPQRPEWLCLGAFVKTLGWCGQITEIAESDGAIYVRIFGPKSVYFGNVHGDLVEFDPARISPVSTEEAVTNADAYLKMERERLEQLRALAEQWQMFANKSEPPG